MSVAYVGASGIVLDCVRLTLAKGEFRAEE
jgi:hypothetical protein